MKKALVCHIFNFSLRTFPQSASMNSAQIKKAATNPIMNEDFHSQLYSHLLFCCGKKKLGRKESMNGLYENRH